MCSECCWLCLRRCHLGGRLQIRRDLQPVLPQLVPRNTRQCLAGFGACLTRCYAVSATASPECLPHEGGYLPRVICTKNTLVSSYLPESALATSDVQRDVVGSVRLSIRSVLVSSSILFPRPAPLGVLSFTAAELHRSAPGGFDLQEETVSTAVESPCA
jgi:hypothetical protein